MKRLVLLIAATLRVAVFFAQQSPPDLPCPTLKPPVSQPANFLQAFRQGQFNGHFRSYFMATDNARALSDYYAWAVGGGLHFSTAAFHGVSFGIGGAFNYNVASSNLVAKDSLTGAVNRYEIGLFDVEDPTNRSNMNRMEELWLRYAWKKSRITVGRQLLQTPFVNYQDGRMRPTAEAGIWAEINARQNTRIEGGWLWKISPRSTLAWYGIGKSIGLYPKGLNPDGSGSGYPEHLQSAGIGVLGITRQVGKRTKVQVWDYYVQNIFHTAFAQADYTHPLRNDHKLLFGLQMIHQDALSYGGHAEASKTYFQKGGQSNVVSVQTGWQRGPWQALAAYTRITADGRFLSPREWGREPFYTAIPRERMEGSGDSHAITGRLGWQTKSKKLHLEAVYGRFYLPDVKNAALNKYAFPSFDQFNLDVRYACGGMFEGLRVQFLYVRKGRLGEVYNNDKYVINRIEMSHYNLILHYTY